LLVIQYTYVEVSWRYALAVDKHVESMVVSKISQLRLIHLGLLSNDLTIFCSPSDLGDRSLNERNFVPSEVEAGAAATPFSLELCHLLRSNGAIFGGIAAMLAYSLLQHSLRFHSFALMMNSLAATSQVTTSAIS
jgi:hypothetical protein